MSPYVHARGRAVLLFLTLELIQLIFSSAGGSVCWRGSLSPKKSAGVGDMAGLMRLFAKWKKPLKLTTAAVLLFPLCAQAGIHGGGHCDPGSCSAALRVFDKLSPTLSVQSVSLSNTPSEALLSNATPRVQPLSSCSPGSASLQKPTEVLNSPSHCSTTPD